MFITPDQNPLTEGIYEGDSPDNNDSDGSNNGIELPPQKLTKAEAYGQIDHIRAQCLTMGANDSELPVLTQLMSDVLAGKVDPESAVTKANGILSSKADYH